jgi:hypothetical protein
MGHADLIKVGKYQGHFDSNALPVFFYRIKFIADIPARFFYMGKDRININGSTAGRLTVYTRVGIT